MILELDMGNSRIKWRRVESDNGQLIDSGSFAAVDQLIGSTLAERRPELVRICSVRSSFEQHKIRDWVAVLWGLTPQFAAVRRSCGGVAIQYEDLSRLGVDRWLAMLAAYQRARSACVVVDAGTAFTLDIIAADGQHCGGYILPGLGLMIDSLQKHTSIRLASSHFKPATAAGNSTEEAVLQGALASQVALIRQVLGELGGSAEQVSLFLTGGDAALLAQVVQHNPMEVAASLVLDGLALACPADVAQGN